MHCIALQMDEPEEKVVFRMPAEMRREIEALAERETRDLSKQIRHMLKLQLAGEQEVRDVDA